MKTVNPPQTKFAWGIIMFQLELNELKQTLGF